eukprot:g9175.t1
MSEMFRGLTGFSCDLSGWDVSAVKSMAGMFAQCRNFSGDSLACWNTSNCEDMSYMFEDTGPFTQSLCWDCSSCTTMHSMFQGCAGFNAGARIDFRNTGGVRVVERMFTSVDEFPEFSCVCEWDLTSVIAFDGMFSGCLWVEGEPAAAEQFLAAGWSRRTLVQARPKNVVDIRVFQDPRANAKLGITGGRVWDAAVVLAKHFEQEYRLLSQQVVGAAVTTRASAVRLLELGAGTGLCGVASAAVLPRGSPTPAPARGGPGGRRRDRENNSCVVVTDQAAHLELLERNVELNADAIKNENKCRLLAKELDWTSAEMRALLDEARKFSRGTALGFDVPSDAETDAPDPLPGSGVEEEADIFDLAIASDVIYHEEVVEMFVTTLEALVYSGCCRGALVGFELRSAAVTEYFLKRVFEVFSAEFLKSPENFESDAVVLLKLRPMLDEEEEY